MDRSFLSHKSVVKASRNYVCVRLATYEDSEEAKMLASIFVGRSGELENTTFAILSHDGKRQLVRSGRGPRRLYSDAEDLAKTLNSIAKRHAPKDKSSAKKSAMTRLPTLHSLRLALNVAACDNQALVVIHGRDKAHQKQLTKALLPSVWGKAIGRASYASTIKKSDLKAIKGDTSPGVFVVEPGRYGLTGKVIARVSVKKLDALPASFSKALDSFRSASKGHRAHVREGHRKGVHWKTKIPVTDPHARPR